MSKYMIYNLLFLFLSCNSENNEYKKRIIVKTLNVDKDTKIEWYYNSLITGNSPGVIEFKTGKERQLICKSTLICEATLRHDTLTILVEKNEFIELSLKNRWNIKVLIDSTCKGKYLYIK